MGAWSWQTRNRHDRYVRCAKLCTDEGAPIHRLAFSLDEALKVASLPGENEGRFYCFRFLRITGLPPNGDRRIWLTKVQWALSEMAQQAIHGGDPLAASADAVFFRSDQEALQVLLDHILARRAVTEWFWPMVMPEAHTAEGRSLSAELIPLLVEKLRSRPASWVAVAAILFGRPEFDVVGFLYSIPPTLAEGWVAEIAGVGELPPSGEARFSQETLPAIHEAARVFGLRSARTLWLAALAILFDSPSKLIVGAAVHHARSALLRLASLEVVREGGPALTADEESSTDVVMEVGNPAPSRRKPSGSMQAQAHEEAAEANVMTLPSLSKITEGPAGVDSATINGAEIPAPASLPGLDISNFHPAPESPPCVSIDSATRPAVFVEGIASRLVPDSEPVSRRWHSSPGLETRAAGLLFLLNGLRGIGIERALADGLAQADPHFLPRLLLRLAKSVGVRPDDPVRVWLNALLTDSGGDGLTCDRSCWPSNLRPWRDAAPLDYILRVWYLAARRWCWRTAGIPLREVVVRKGMFSVNRTDLDVSLQIEQADIRIRRAGLDLDPGWLPWFGRVVRFHYIFHGEFHA